MISIPQITEPTKICSVIVTTLHPQWVFVAPPVWVRWQEAEHYADEIEFSYEGQHIER